MTVLVSRFYVSYSWRQCCRPCVCLWWPVVSCVHAQPPLGHSYHCTVHFSLVLTGNHSYQLDANRPTENRYHWYKADFEAIAQCIGVIDWYYVCMSQSISFIMLVCIPWFYVDGNWHLCVPKYCKRRIGKRKSYSKKLLRKLIAKKRNLWRRCRLNSSDLQIRWQYRRCTNELRIRCRDFVRQNEERVICSNNLGEFYKHVNSRIQYRTPISALLHCLTAMEM